MLTPEQNCIDEMSLSCLGCGVQKTNVKHSKVGTCACEAFLQYQAQAMSEDLSGKG